NALGNGSVIERPTADGINGGVDVSLRNCRTTEMFSQYGLRLDPVKHRFSEPHNGCIIGIRHATPCRWISLADVSHCLARCELEGIAQRRRRGKWPFEERPPETRVAR